MLDDAGYYINTNKVYVCVYYTVYIYTHIYVCVSIKDHYPAFSRRVMRQAFVFHGKNLKNN